MADVNLDDEQTLDQSNSGESDDQTDDSAANNLDDTGDDSGNADDSNGDDDGGSDDQQEGRKSRGEVRHERYIDKLASEIRSSTDNSRYTDDLFGGASEYQPLKYEEDKEYDPKDLEADRKAAQEAARREGIQRGLSQTSPRLERELWADRFDIDRERVTAKWEALNPEKEDSYKPNLEAKLVQRYIQFTGMTKDDQGRVSIEKPNIRFRDFVDAEMQNLEDYAAERNAQSSKNLVAQAAKTGVRPNGQARTSKGGHGFDPNDPVNSVNRMTKKQYFELGGKEASDAYLRERGLA